MTGSVQVVWDPPVQLCWIFFRYSYHHKLVPLLLIFFFDEVEDISKSAIQDWDKVLYITMKEYILNTELEKFQVVPYHIHTFQYFKRKCLFIYVFILRLVLNMKRKMKRT